LRSPTKRRRRNDQRLLLRFTLSQRKSAEGTSLT
jgi:hypothetical protein